MEQNKQLGNLYDSKWKELCSTLQNTTETEQTGTKPAYSTNHPAARLPKEEKEARFEAIVNDLTNKL